MAAAAIHRTLTDEGFRQAMLLEQKKQLEQYSYGKVREKMLNCLAALS